MVVRYDTIRLDKIERTPSGGLRLPAVLTKPGVFSYSDAAGNVIREYRPPEEVWAADSVASLGDAPVTIGHPTEAVSPENWGKLSTGHVRADTLHSDDRTHGVAATVVVARRDALAGIQSTGPDALRDISAGYQVEIDPTPGTTPDGQAYDRVQRSIRYNHVALLKRGDGRQGSDVGLRLDSAGSQLAIEPTPTTDPKMQLTFKIDGKDTIVEAGSADHLRAQARLDAARDQALADVAADRDREKARADDAAAKLTAAQARLDAVDAAETARARTELETRARTVLGKDARFDGKTDREVKVAVIAAKDTRFDGKDRADAYVDARFDLMFEGAAPRTDTADLARALGGGPPPAERTDAAPTAETDPLAAIARAQNHARTLGR